MSLIRLLLLALCLASVNACGEQQQSPSSAVSDTETAADSTQTGPEQPEREPEPASEPVRLALATPGATPSSDTTEVLAADKLDTLAFRQPWTGDLDGMEERRVIRVLTVYSVGRYWLDGVQERGLTYELGKQFEKYLNQHLQRGHMKVHVVFIPVARDQLIPSLLEGRGDIIMASLSITPERRQLVDFSTPISKPLSEILVTGPAAPPLESIDDLAGQTLYVRRSSSYRESVEDLNHRFASEGSPLVKIEPVSELLEDDDLIEMVNAGLLPWAIVDEYKPHLWRDVFTKLVVRDDIVFRKGGRLAWAFRKNSPLLAAKVNPFLKDHRQGSLMGNILFNRYIRDFDWAANALSKKDYARFEAVIELFRTYGEQYGIDYLMAAAQGYQESRLDQSVRSQAGAVGIMQLLPTTASDPNVGIPDIYKEEPNIHAGIKYLDYLRDRYFSDPDITPLNRTLLAFGAYNAGPARMIKLRSKAAKEGYDPNVWFDNVEVIAAKDIGRETVQYVANIYKYYIAYRLIIEQHDRRKKARAGAGIE